MQAVCTALDPAIFLPLSSAPRADVRAASLEKGVVVFIPVRFVYIYVLCRCVCVIRIPGVGAKNHKLFSGAAVAADASFFSSSFARCRWVKGRRRQHRTRCCQQVHRREFSRRRSTLAFWGKRKFLYTLARAMF